MIQRLIPITAIAATALIACADIPEPEAPGAMPPPQPAETQNIQMVALDEDPNSESRGSISIDPEIARVCNLPTAYFAFDSSDIRGDAAHVLDVLAACLTDGELSSRRLKIVGHADPRGPVDYNFALGQRRAGSVESYLNEQGVPTSRIQSASMGELEAKGEDEAGWAEDRKVEILLADKAVIVEGADLPQQPSPDDPRTE